MDAVPQTLPRIPSNISRPLHHVVLETTETRSWKRIPDVLNYKRSKKRRYCQQKGRNQYRHVRRIRQYHQLRRKYSSILSSGTNKRKNSGMKKQISRYCLEKKELLSSDLKSICSECKADIVQDDESNTVYCHEKGENRKSVRKRRYAHGIRKNERILTL